MRTDDKTFVIAASLLAIGTALTVLLLKILE